MPGRVGGDAVPHVTPQKLALAGRVALLAGGFRILRLVFAAEGFKPRLLVQELASEEPGHLAKVVRLRKLPCRHVPGGGSLGKECADDRCGIGALPEANVLQSAGHLTRAHRLCGRIDRREAVHHRGKVVRVAAIGGDELRLVVCARRARVRQGWRQHVEAREHEYAKIVVDPAPCDRAASPKVEGVVAVLKLAKATLLRDEICLGAGHVERRRGCEEEGSCDEESHDLSRFTSRAKSLSLVHTSMRETSPRNLAIRRKEQMKRSARWSPLPPV